MKRFYPRGFQHILDGDVDYTNSRIAVALIDLAIYTPDFDNDEYLSDISPSAIISSALLDGKTNVNGIADANDTTFLKVEGAVCRAIVFYLQPENLNTETSILIAFNDGKSQVVAAMEAVISDTTVYVDKLKAGIASGAEVEFTNGTIATLTSPAAVGDRSLSVTALTGGILPEEVAEVDDIDSYFPITPDGNDIVFTWGEGAERIFALWVE